MSSVAKKTNNFDTFRSCSEDSKWIEADSITEPSELVNKQLVIQKYGLLILDNAYTCPANQPAMNGYVVRITAGAASLANPFDPSVRTVKRDVWTSDCDKRKSVKKQIRQLFAFQSVSYRI